MAGEKLTAKQDKFCLEYLVDRNGTRAAIRAGYGEKGAAVTACRMLKNANILARVRELQAEEAERLSLSADAVTMEIWRTYQRCMQKTPVMEYDHETGEMRQTGEWQFDSRGATNCLKMLGDRVGMFEQNVKLSVEKPIIVDDIPRGTIHGADAAGDQD